MTEYTIRLKDHIDDSGESTVGVSFESSDMELVHDESKAFQLASYVLDCIQSLEEVDNEQSH
jgi:hypothetical protein